MWDNQQNEGEYVVPGARHERMLVLCLGGRECGKIPDIFELTNIYMSRFGLM